MQLDLNIPDSTRPPKNFNCVSNDECEMIPFDDLVKIRLERAKQSAIRSALKMTDSMFAELAK